MTSYRTARLLLRRWGDHDRASFHQLNADPVVMATIAAPMTRAESDAFMDRIEAGFDRNGFGLWCVESDGECIGFTGLSVPWFRDGVEVGWRIRSEHWGHGFATEAGTESLRVAFDEIGLDEVISFTAATNVRSRRVMEKLGLQRVPTADFEHPSVPDGNPLRQHVLYRIGRSEYRSAT